MTTNDVLDAGAVTKAIPASLQWREGRLFLLDQTRLPLETVYEEQRSAEQLAASIKALKVRGAPAIGVAAAYGLCVEMQSRAGLPAGAFLAELESQAERLAAVRPTAVNLAWAVRRLVAAAKTSGANSAAALQERLVREAEAIHAEDVALCEGIARHGVELIAPGAGVLTHCNAGALATTGLGTATAPMYLAHARGIAFRVFADETRPLLQGARLTAWELGTAGLDVTLITDNMAAHMMAAGEIDLVITGTDRVAANGDVANKIGTLGVAVLARHFEIPFYVAAPSSSIDLATPTGADIVIEEREAAEVTSFGARRTAPELVKVRNPAFDVTPAALVTGLVTEKGVVRAPYESALRAQFAPR